MASKTSTYIVGPGGSLVYGGRILTEGMPVPEEALKSLGKAGGEEALASKTIVLVKAAEPEPPVPTRADLEAKALALALGTEAEIKALSDADLAALVKDKA